MGALGAAQLRVGVLVLGSLYWQDTPERRRWRTERLRIDERVPVPAPVRYWRCSRTWGRTYTMVLADGDGTALAIPCAREAHTYDDVLAEATALWRAEDPLWRGPDLGGYGGWGAVGLLADPASADACRVQAEWRDGVVLDFDWPEGAGVDLLLAAENTWEDPPPDPHRIADAWIANTGGHERYFFHTFAAGVRTPDDEAIWRRMVSRQPAFLKQPGYAGAIARLNASW